MNAKRIAATIPALGLAAAALSTMPAHAQLTGGTTKSPEVLVIRKVDAADNRYIGADSNAYHSVAKGATFAGDSCTRGGNDLNWNCENLDDYAWFHDMLPEDGNTDGYYNREIPLTSSPDGSVVQRVDVAETSAPTGYDKIDGTSTVHLDPATNTWAADALPAGVTLTHSNGFAYWSWNDKKTVTPAAKVPNLVIVKTDARYASEVADGKADNAGIGTSQFAVERVDKGAVFSGTTTLDGKATSLNNTSWFRSELGEFGSTGDDMMAYEPTTVDQTRTVSVSEDVAPTGYDKIDGTATVHNVGGKWVADKLPKGVTLDQWGGYYWLNFHDTKTAPKPVQHLALVQIDTYHNQFANGRKLTAAQIETRDTARAADKKAGKLVYRKGSAATWLWGSTSSKIVTVDLCKAPKLGADTDMWVLGAGATKTNPWGTSHTTVQTAPKVGCAIGGSYGG